VILGRAVHSLTGVNLLAVLSAPLSVATAAGAGGWLLTEAAGATVVSGIAGGLVAVTLFHAGLMLVSRPLVLDSYRFVAQAIRAAMKGASVTA
jgi:hypothetical protein